MSNARELSKLVVGGEVSAGGVDDYADVNALPPSPSLGDLAFITGTNTLYVYNGSAWFNIAIANQAPTAISGNEASYVLALDGTPTTVTLTSTDPEGFPLTWSSAVSGDTQVGTVTNTDNVFTITPSTDEADVGTLSITFSVTDGSNTENSTSTFTLAFANWDFSTYSLTSSQEVSSAYNISREASIWVDPAGSYYAIVGRMDQTVRMFNSTNYALGTSQYRFFSTGLTYAGGIFLKPDGSKMYIFDGGGSEQLREYDLTTNYDVSTATNLTTYTINDATAASYGGTIGFSASGDYFWLDNGGVGGINSWSLSTPWDVSTRSSIRLDYITTSLEWGSNQAHMSTFSPDGTVWIVYGGDASNGNAKSIFSYNLSTAFDPQSATTLIGKTTVNNYGGGYNNNGIHALGGHVHFYDRNYGYYRHYSG